MFSYLWSLVWGNGVTVDNKHHNGNGIHDDDAALMPEFNGVEEDRCSKRNCARFLARRNDFLCAFHAVRGARDDQGGTKRFTGVRQNSQQDPFRLLQESYQMWLRSKIGANKTEDFLRMRVSSVHDFYSFAATIRNDWQGNAFRYCESLISDYGLVHEFLEHMRTQKQKSATSIIELVMSIRLFVEFRKFHLPVKGIIADPFSATELLLDVYANFVVESIDLDGVDAPNCAMRYRQISSRDLKAAVEYHKPEFESIVSILKTCPDLDNIENAHDLNFAASFICLFLLSCAPDTDAGSFWKITLQNVKQRLEDDGRSATTVILDSDTLIRLSHDESLALQRYMTQIRPRLSHGGNALLTNQTGRFLESSDIKRRIESLVYAGFGMTPCLDKIIQDVAEPETKSALLEGPSRNRKKNRKRQIKAKVRKTKFPKNPLNAAANKKKSIARKANAWTTKRFIASQKLKKISANAKRNLKTIKTRVSKRQRHGTIQHGVTGSPPKSSSELSGSTPKRDTTAEDAV